MMDISFAYYYRATQIRQRFYEAALEEFERVGDIVAAAAVGWGTFFRYFPRQEDVLLEAAAHRHEIMSDRPPGAWRGPSQHHVILSLETVAYGFVPRLNGDSVTPAASGTEG